VFQSASGMAKFGRIRPLCMETSRLLVSLNGCNDMWRVLHLGYQDDSRSAQMTRPVSYSAGLYQVRLLGQYMMTAELCILIKNHHYSIVPSSNMLSREQGDLELLAYLTIVERNSG
jgi:hypothetical protein